MVYVECYPDAVLVRALGVPGRHVKHERGKGNITNRLRGVKAGLGLMDEDPASHQARELGNYEVVHRVGGLALMAHVDGSSRRLILICPRLEDWMYRRAAACRLDPGDFGLPPTAAELHSIARYELKEGFVRFLERLREADTEFKRLREWLAPEITR